MSRMEIKALGALADAANVGGYTLPPEVLSALNTHRRTLEIALPDPQPLDVEATAARLVGAVSNGEKADPAALVRDAADTQTVHVAVEHARRVISSAIEISGETATLLAADLTERIITEHLRPAFGQLLDEVRETSADLGSYGLNVNALITAPAKARNAYAKLPGLVERHRLLWEARAKVNNIGHRKPQHDANNLFATFEDAMALRPGWKAPARINPVDTPTEPMDYLLWLVSPAASVGRPWLPTVAEQDAAYLKQFGEAEKQRAAAALSARAYAGQRV